MIETDGYTSVMSIAYEELLPANSLTPGNLLPLPAGIASQPGAHQLTLCQDIVALLPCRHSHAYKGDHTTECKALTKVTPGQSAPISHHECILPTLKLFCWHCLHLFLCMITHFL